MRKIGKDSVGAIALLPLSQPYIGNKLSYELLDESRLEKILAAHHSDIQLGMIEEEDDFRLSTSLSNVSSTP